MKHYRMTTRTQTERAAWGMRMKATAGRQERPMSSTEHPYYAPDTPWARVNDLTSTLDQQLPGRGSLKQWAAGELRQVAEQFELLGFPERDLARLLQALARLLV
jgi:hypothetical protein